jgi:NADPH-dependent glutamate synthase beta subunit-like oxidoreductase
LAHEEGGGREYCINTKELTGKNGKLTALKTVRVGWQKDDSGRWQMQELPDSEQLWPAELVLLAMGFLGPEPDNVVAQLGCELNQRGNSRPTGTR